MNESKLFDLKFIEKAFKERDKNNDILIIDYMTLLKNTNLKSDTLKINSKNKKK